MAHTPGPLSVGYYASQDGVSSSHYSVKKRDKTLVRTINQVATEEDESNVRLYAASPDLLEACKFALEWLQEVKDRNNLHCKGWGMMTLENAIAKAEGR